MRGRNWFLFDMKKKNKLGEPAMVFFSHEGPVEHSEPIPDQNKEAFGVGGLLLRCLAYRVFSKNPAYEGFGWG
jgi:hypothetical protein